ncbi:MAG: type II toxin-antitoxin system Phd/YefM family antitoxin [Caldilineaceae bacterium]|nr:type II toxin-antitoxin system Phd/YefM family antitoxin [Caldilineaceae bacterium]
MTQNRQVRVVTATEAKNRFGAIIKQAYANDEHLIVQRGGIPVVAIVPIQDYERLLVEGEVSQELAADIAQSGSAASARSRLRTVLEEAWKEIPELPEDEVEQDIREAMAAVRNQ